MSLTIKKTSTLMSESRIDENLIVTLSAEISSDYLGNSYIRQIVNNQEMYAKNRVECRKDIADFQVRVYELEDRFIEEGFEFEEESDDKTVKDK